MSNSMTDFLNVLYVVFSFCSALSLGALKGIFVGPIASSLLILGNVGVILALLPAQVTWTVYALVKTKRFDATLKFAFLFALPPLFGLWLILSIAGSVLVGMGYGFFTPWVSTFEAFRQVGESKKFLHCIVDGTWGTIKGSCTVVRDFGDICYHSYPQYLKELHEGSGSDETHSIRLIEVPGCLAVGLMGLIVEIPLYTAIAIIKSPYMLFKGWHRLLHDLVSREGPFLETACVPVAGLVILLWPLIVIGSILLAIFSSIFVGLYGSVIVYQVYMQVSLTFHYLDILTGFMISLSMFHTSLKTHIWYSMQERSFRRGVAYVIAMVSEFDEYTNDWLYLREGSILPKPRYRKKKASHSAEFPVGASNAAGSNAGCLSSEAPALLVPSLAPSRSIREAIQEVKMVHIWEDMMKGCEMRGKVLLDANVITPGDLNECTKAKDSQETIVGLGLPSYAFLHCLLHSVKVGSSGLLLTDGVDVTQQNRPRERVLDFFFQPVMVLKEQIRVLRLVEGEVGFLEKITLFGCNAERFEAWDNGSLVPQDALRAAQIQAISRRVTGMTRSISKFPTYRRRFRDVIKALIIYSLERGGSSASYSSRRVASMELP
ncbi:uncharacterized membrane protein At3g27390-like isoform X1 [Magnolia sinica]|uniref:uncharacterized membrane protein At3g27390-like isoform X1 n=1 Tax=Magnolia sinica TaxID=86752 RepID=UPI0026583658|nr:uncharacterized membrane protein At3g27390-like isoform X1 [Magnolia sinica]